MRLALIFSALAAFLHACSDDDTPGPPEPFTPIDAGAYSIQVTNVGSACTSPESCEGPGAKCMTVSSTNTKYADGYCTAECMASEECGPGAVCPVGDALADPGFEPKATWPRTCFRRCTVDASGATGCRAGYTCRSLAEAYGVRGEAPEAMRAAICIPAPRKPAAATHDSP